MLLDLSRELWHSLPLTSVASLVQLRDVARGFIRSSRLWRVSPWAALLTEMRIGHAVVGVRLPSSLSSPVLKNLKA